MESWPKSTYIKESVSLGTSQEQAFHYWKTARIVQDRGLPAILTLGHLSKHTNITYRYLGKLVSREINPYRTFQIKKRSGGFRHISVPEPRLLYVQQWIDKAVLSGSSIPSFYAFSANSSLLKCASEHVGANWLIKIDLENFFESISEIQVYHVFCKLGYPSLVSFQLARLCTRLSPAGAQKYSLEKWKIYSDQYRHVFGEETRLGHLAQGAPSSPKLSNLVAESLDKRLQTLANEKNLIFTRYADDIVFSSSSEFDRSRAVSILREAISEIRQEGFKPNFKKSGIVSPGGRKIVVGLLVDGDKIRIPKKWKDRLRMHVHYLTLHGAIAHSKKRGFDSVLGLKDHVEGMIAYAKSIDPAFARNCEEKLNSSECWLR